MPAPDLFPRRRLGQLLGARAAVRCGPELTVYPDAQGLLELRAAIAAHLAATRGLIADPEHIVVTAGTQQALRIAADLLLDPGDPAWVEEPGYIAGRGALLAAGAVPVPVPSDAEGWTSPPAWRLGARARGWRWWRRRMRRRWGARCRSAGGWRCWTGRRAPMPGCWRTTATPNSAGKAGRCRRWRAWIGPAG